MKISAYKVPIFVHIAYILFTLSINLFGPKIYDQYTNKLGVILYIFAYLIVVYNGYCLGLRSTTHKRVIPKESVAYLRIIPLVKKCIKLSCILFLVNALYMVSIGRFTLDLMTIGQNYISFYEYYGAKTETDLFTFENIFIVIIAIPQFIATSLGFLYYRYFPKRDKLFFWLFLLLILITNTISNGNQKSIGDIVILFLIAILFLTYTAPALRTKLKKWIVVTMVVFVALMSFSQLTRLSSRDIMTVQDINSKVADYVHFNQDHIIFKICGEKVGIGISSFVTGYLSDGYYGLSKSLELPFEWSYGIGGSAGLTTICEKISDVEVYEKTYLGRMEQSFNSLGINGKRNWHSIFPWLASDLTFAGVLIYFFFISYIYAKSWKEALLYKNGVSYLMFCLLTIMFIFVPANNQIFHGYNYILITSFIFIYWIRRHQSYNYYVRSIS